MLRAPAVQMLEYLRAHADPRTTAVFGGPSERFLRGTDWEASAHAAGSLGDALLAVVVLESALPCSPVPR
jgi:hypothetical protein